MRAIQTMSLLLAWAALSAAILPGADETLQDHGRELSNKYKETVISVKLVITTCYVYGGRETNKRESKNEISGTVIDASGLTVLSLFALDPSAARSDWSFDTGGENMKVKTESNVTDVKLILSDGTEIPAQVVLKDKDLDLAFVKPKEKLEKPCQFVNFAKPRTAPEILDDILVIGRLGREVNRVTSIALGQVEAIVKKPRTFYVCGARGGHAALGCPVFNAQGETLGLTIMRMNPVKESGFFGGGGRPVVLPSEDLLEVAKQALAAKPEDPAKEKPEEKK